MFMSWQTLDESTLSKIKLQKDFEDQTAKQLTPLYQAAKNPIIKLYIHRIILDTQKHSDTYQMLIELNQSAQMGEESKALGEKEIKSHITEEAKMLKLTMEISQTLKDEKTKHIIDEIIKDEERHHHDLLNLLEVLKKQSVEWDAYLYDLITGFP
jgi:rubrerythrin